MPAPAPLVLQPRDVHVGRDPAVALPVDPNEHVALVEVGPVEVPRGVWTRAELEHHRCQTQLRDCLLRRNPLGRELLQRRAHEHAQPLIWRAYHEPRVWQEPDDPTL